MPRFAVLLVGAAILLPGATAGAAMRQEPALREKVAVVNIEVPVRVFRDEAPLAGLQKDDFRLFEDGELQAINGFFQRRKKMRTHRVNLAAEAELTSLPSRYFVLSFRIMDYNEDLRKGMEYFFEHFLREQDQLLVLVNERTLLLNQDVWQVKRREILEQVLRDEASRARQAMDAYFLRVKEDIDQSRLRVLLENRGQNFNLAQILGFLQGYLNAWQDFKKKYLTPDLDSFYNFARHLQNIQAEKWVLSFYQVELFPQLRLSGSLRRQIDELVNDLFVLGGVAEHFARDINRLMETIDRSFGAPGEFPAEQIGKMLIRVDTTYHCFINSVSRESLLGDVEYRKVASDLEKSLREIAASSGGEVFLSNDISSALHAIEEKEDVYYVLTYEPKNPKRPGKVKIELNDPRCRLLYDDQVRSDYIAEYLKKRKGDDPTLQLERISLSGTRLQLEITSFKMVEAKAKKSGQLHVAVTVRDDGGRTLYKRGRALTAQESRVSLAIDFPFLKPGKYYFIAEVSDRLTGKTAMDVLPAELR